MEDDLKLSKVEYLSNRLLDHTQILNLSLNKQTIILQMKRTSNGRRPKHIKSCIDTAWVNLCQSKLVYPDKFFLLGLGGGLDLTLFNYEQLMKVLNWVTLYMFIKILAIAP